MMDIVNMVTEYFSGTLGKIELLATISSAICVWLAVKQNIWTWFWGAIGVILFGYLFYEYKLYSDAGLQILFFLPCQVIGYYWWMRRGPNADNDLPVISLKNATRLVIVMGIIMAAGVNGYFMTFTDASFPYVDALTTWMSIAAQILMIKKIWESWILWVSMDIIAINVYWLKGLYVTSGLYVAFLIMATMGLIAWYKKTIRQ